MRRSTFIIISLFCLLGGLILIYGIGLYRLKEQATQSAVIIKGDFRAAVHSLNNLDTRDARQSFQSIYQEINLLKNKTQNLPFITNLLKQIPETLTSASDLSIASVDLAANLDKLKNNFFQWVMQRQGDQLITNLEQINVGIDTVLPLMGKLRYQAFLFRYPLAEDFAAANNNLHKSHDVVTHLIAWLKQPEPQHVLIFFQNQTEIRPAGGFLGSFADVTLQRGSLINLEVKDIYDVDGQLTKKILPPAPLQKITPTWGARDANWFFDFPTSARKVIELLKLSKIYQERETHFVGAIAVNTTIIEDLLDVVGGIELPEYQITITAENFLPTVQREVEAGADNKAGRPKTILQIITPRLLEKLGRADESQKKELLKKLSFRFLNKDIMVYFDDIITESYLKNLGVAGEIINLPEIFNGDYLAVVNANIGGGKSDRFMKQTVVLSSNIDLGRRLHNELRINRSHQGTTEIDWWYAKANYSFLQIFLPRQTTIKSFQGGDLIASDPETASLHNVFGQQELALWQTVKPGEKKVIALRSDSNQLIDPALPFVFVFEKQSGVEINLQYSIAAPLGYIWKESGQPLFKYQSDTLPARLRLELHLEKVK